MHVSSTHYYAGAPLVVSKTWYMSFFNQNFPTYGGRVIMFGLCPNKLSLLQFSLVFPPMCPIFVVIFLPEFSLNQLQTLAQIILIFWGGVLRLL